MEIADIFVVNKADRPDADLFVRNLRLMLAPAFSNPAIPVPVVKTVAAQKKGIAELLEAITDSINHKTNNEKRFWLLAEKAFHLIQQKRMKDISKAALQQQIIAAGDNFNLYQFIKPYF
jgi:LAO/AO transport system kinase